MSFVGTSKLQVLRNKSRKVNEGPGGFLENISILIYLYYSLLGLERIIVRK